VFHHRSLQVQNYQRFLEQDGQAGFEEYVESTVGVHGHWRVWTSSGAQALGSDSRASETVCPISGTEQTDQGIQEPYSHGHAIVVEGGFDEAGRLVHIPLGNFKRMSEYFRRVIIKFFLKKNHQRQSGHQFDQLEALWIQCRHFGAHPRRILSDMRGPLPIHRPPDGRTPTAVPQKDRYPREWRSHRHLLHL